MATTQEILAAARDLGKLIGDHEAAKKVARAAGQLNDDTEAQRVLNDYQRQAQAVAEKEAQRKPVEVADKRQLEALHEELIRNALLREFQMAQMDYIDLMRQVDDAISGTPSTPGAAPTPTGETGAP